MIKALGSFTGIRIGIATVKAFQDSLSIDCIGISSLESLAYLVNKDGFIISLINCKNDNCYFALYEKKDENYHEIISPSTDTIEKALDLCNEKTLSKSSITFVGDFEIYREKINSIFNNKKIEFSNKNCLDSYYLGLVGFKKWKEKKLDDVLPLYLKKPQAQKQLEKNLEEVELFPMTLEDFNSIFEKFTIDFDEFWNPSLLKDELENKNSKYIVAKLHDKVVGFAGIKIMIDEADIMNIVVRKNYRNQGIGSLLLKDLINLSIEFKLKCITLEVMEENYPAIHLYKKFDFKECGFRKNYYKDKDGIIMKKLT